MERGAAQESRCVQDMRDGFDAAGCPDAGSRGAANRASAADGVSAKAEVFTAAEVSAADGCEPSAGNAVAAASPAAGEVHADSAPDIAPDDAAPVAVIRGVVEHGRRLGRELGFPTANLAVDEGLEAADGVYASVVEVGGVRYRAMSNLGSNPSVGGAPRHLETHLFGFEGSLYGREVRVVLLRKVRDERRFDTVEELREQIARDKEQIMNLKMNLK